MGHAVVPRGIYLAGYEQGEIDALPAIIGKTEVARLARVSERTVLREAVGGKLRGSFKIGNQWRFNTAAICEQFGIERAS
jgi:hypothetical protein